MTFQVPLHVSQLTFSLLCSHTFRINSGLNQEEVGLLHGEDGEVRIPHVFLMSRTWLECVSLVALLKEMKYNTAGANVC